MTEQHADRPDSTRPDSTRPDSGRARDETLAKVLETYLADLEAGRAPARQELYEAHPTIAGQLRDCLQAIEFVHGARQRLEGLPGAAAQLDDFRIVREVGSGGMGVVYEAEQVSLGRRVALKVLRFGPSGEPEAAQRFRREAEIIAKLHHTNIVPVYAVGEAGGVHYFAMQFIDGQSLAEHAGETGRVLDLDEVARIGLDTAEALAHAHERNVIHRDVKPSNLLIAQDQRVWLTDFGLARHDDDLTLSLSGALLGTPRYMSPEQASAAGRVDQRADLYGLGATLYELASGRPVFDAKTPHEVIQRILSDEPVPLRRVNAEIPQDFETMVMKCLAKEPQDRYETARDFASDLRSYRQGQSISARRPSLVQRVTRTARRHRKSVAIAAASATLALLASALAIVGMAEARDAQNGKLTIETADAGARIEVVDENGRQAISTLRAPIDEPVVLEAGAYRLRGSIGELPSETFLFDIVPGDEQEHVLDLRQRLLWRPFEARGRERLEMTTLPLRDRTDLLLLTVRSGLRRIDGATRQPAWEIPYPGSAVTETIKELGHDRESALTLTSQSLPRVVSDLNGDGVPDLLAGIRRNNFMAVSGQDGRLLWRSSSDDRGRLIDVSSPVDVDGDNEPDLIAALTGDDNAFAIEAIAGATGESLWRTPVRSEHDVLFGPLQAMVGTEEAVVIATSNRVLALRMADGQAATTPIELAPALVHDLQIVDIDDDRSSELLVLTMPTTDNDQPRLSTLHAYDLDSQQQLWTRQLAAQWPEEEADAAQGTPPPADWPLAIDLDRDGTHEIVVPGRRTTAKEAGYALELLDGTTGQPRWTRCWFDAAGKALVRASAGEEVLQSLASGMRSEGGAFGALAGLAFGGRARREQIDRLVAGPDIDNDGHDDLFCANFHGSSLYVTALSGNDGRTLWWWRERQIDRASILPLAFWEPGSDGLPLLLVGYDNEENEGRFTSRNGVKQRRSRSRTFLLSASRGELQDVIHGAPRLQVTDLNGDGLRDLLATRKRGNINNSRFTVTTSIDGIGGRPPRSFRRLGTLNVAADFNGDGIDDLVGKGVAVSGRDGEMIWRQQEAGGRCWAPAPLGDLDGDGIADLIDTSLDVEAFSGRDGQPLWTVEIAAMVAKDDADLAMKGGSRGSGDPETTMCDLDGDGKAEVLHFFTRTFSNETDWSSTRREPRLAAIAAAKGTVMWSVPIGPEGHRTRSSEPSFGDVDGDDKPEIVIVTIDEDELWHLRLMDGRDGSLRWRQPLSKRNYGVDDCPITVQLADLDRDGACEVVTIDRVVELAAPLAKQRGRRSHARVTRALFRVQARDGQSGQVRWTWSGEEVGEHQISDTEPSWRANAVVCDVDSHGPCICIQMISEGRYNGGTGPLRHRGNQEALQTLVLDGRGQPLYLGDPISIGRAVNRLDGGNACDVAAYDLDGDGSKELLWANEKRITCTNGLPNDIRWTWDPDGKTRIGPFDGRAPRGTGLRMVPVGGEQLLAVAVRRALRTPEFSRSQRDLVLLDARGTRRFDLAGREWLATAGSPLPLTIQSQNGATSCWSGVATGPSATATSVAPQVEPDPRYARRLPWYHRGELSFFWAAVIDSLTLLVVPLALLCWAWRWRSWAVVGVFVGYAVIVTGAYAFGKLPAMRHLLSMSGFGYAIDLRERAPWLAWLSIGPIHLGRVLLGLPLIVVAGSGLLWLVRRRWLRLGALVAATAALCAAIVGYYLSVDAGHRSPLEHYVWDDAWRVSLHSVYLVGLLMIAMGLTLALRRGWFRFRRSPKAA